MDKSKLEAKLEQAQTKRNAIFADIESLRSNEAEADKEIAGIKADLKALDKPELKEGDFGHWSDSNDGVLIVVNGSGGEKRWYSPDEGQLRKLSVNNNRKFIKLGNLKEVFDDLAAIGEGQNRFEMKDESMHGLEVFKRMEYIILKDDTRDEIAISFKMLHDFILNLRRMEATLKTK